MKKKISLILMLAFVVAILSGCGIQTDPANALTPETASGVWQSFVLLLIQVITWVTDRVGSLGVAIIIVTVLTRLAVMPLMLKSMSSSAKMQTIQPEIQELQKRYAGKTDSESRLEMNAKMQKLYKEYGVNPIAGCLPMLVQIPLMMAFFQAFSRHPLIASNDISYFLGMSLSSSAEIPNIIFAVLVTALMYFSQSMMQKRTQGSNANAQPGMMDPKMMSLMFLPIMFATVYFSPLAMGLHFLIGQVMMNIQSFIIRKPGVAPMPF